MRERFPPITTPPRSGDHRGCPETPERTPPWPPHIPAPAPRLGQCRIAAEPKKPDPAVLFSRLGFRKTSGKAFLASLKKIKVYLLGTTLALPARGCCQQQNGEGPVRGPAAGPPRPPQHHRPQLQLSTRVK